MTKELSDADFAAFQALVYEVAGIHLAANKRDLLAVRLGRRIHALKLSGYRAYYQLLTTSDPNHDERERFINSLTTNKTHFFREPHHFDFLRDQVIARLRTRVAAGAPRRLRIWSAAASTGEEAYSAAMVAHRALGRDGYTIEIIASDIDTDVLARAAEALYSPAQIEETPPELAARYLRREAAQWRVCDELRSLVQFHRVNLIHDTIPFQGTFDAIFLRNVIIYFDRPNQIRLFQRLRPYVADAGHLFLGHSESLLGLSEQFVTAGQTIYRPRARRATSTRLATHPPVTRLAPGNVVVSPAPSRIDTVVGPCVSVCLFDPTTKVGGMNQFSTPAGVQGVPVMEQLVARMAESGAARHSILAKLVGGGGSASEREAGERDVDLAETFLERTGIPIVSKRVGGDTRLEVQFFTHSGRLLCRDAG